MDISIFGTGYVGLVSAARLAEFVHNAVFTHVDLVKIKKLKKRIFSIWDWGLEVLVERNVINRRAALSNATAYHMAESY